MKALLLFFLLVSVFYVAQAQVAIDSNGKLYMLFEGNWRQYYCDQFSKAAFGNQTLWAVYNGLVSRQIGIGRPFHLTLGNLTEVAVGCDGSAFGFWEDNKVYSWNDKFKTWDLFCGTLRSITVGQNSTMVWGIDNGGNIIKSDGFGKWDQEPNTPDTTFNQISAGCDGSLYAVSEDGTMWRRLIGAQNWQAITNMKFSRVSVGVTSADVWAITQGSAVVKITAAGAQQNANVTNTNDLFENVFIPSNTKFIFVSALH